MYDDDDFNDNNGANRNGDTGDDISPPDMGRLTAGSDDPAANVLAPAYVRPVYDIAADTRDDGYFQANAYTATPELTRSMFSDRDLTSTNTDSGFWTVYVLGSYQGESHEDNDPSTEGALFGIADGIPTTALGDGSGVLIFLELHSAQEIVAFPTTNPALATQANTVAHEVGHLISGQHGDGGIMTDATLTITSDQFDPVTLRRLRRFLIHP